MWSTTVALVRMPRPAQTRQNGSRASWSGRSRLTQIGLLYHPWYAALAPRVVGRGSGLCFSHQPSRVSAAHPGCLQGLGALMAMGCHLHEKRKNAETSNHPSQGVSHWLRHSMLWPLAIFRMTLVLQSRQYSSRFRASVSGSTWSNRLFLRQTGQAIHPPCTGTSLPRSPPLFNRLTSFFTDAQITTL